MRSYLFIVLVCGIVAGSVSATELDFSFSVNPNPTVPFGGSASNFDAFDPGSTHYGSYIADGNPYGSWIWHDFGGGSWDWVNPLAQHTDGGVGWTPDIAVIFPGGSLLEQLYFDPVYGDLDDVMYIADSNSGKGWPLSLSDDNSDAAINPVLHSFDLALFGGGTLTEVEVVSYDGVNLTTLWSTNNVAVPSNGHVTFDFGGAPITGVEESLWITYTTPEGVPVQNVALDNVVFSQTPEPGAWLLLSAGAALLLRRRH